MVQKINPYLYIIKIRLVGSPLRDLNCYVIQTSDRNLLIDTGFNQPECLEDLRNGIRELELDMNKTDILITHFHADHSGLVDKIVMPGCQVYMSDIDRAFFEEYQKSDSYWRHTKLRYQQEGFPADILEKALRMNPANALTAAEPVELTPLADGKVLTVGDIQLRCIITPGHTPGHICLYNEKDKFMILGDHILFDITPNITPGPTLHNSLKLYLDSLRRIGEYDVELPLPAHRECSCTMTERIEQLLEHHNKRLAETVDIVRERPGINGYEVAGRMSWSIRAKSWEDFPLTQKWFAMGETLAHLYYLVEEGVIKRNTSESIAVYM